MRDLDDLELLNAHRLPARLTVEHAALLLGFSAPEIILLVKFGLIRYLGRPAKNSRKWFSSVLIDKLCGDEAWLSRATTALGKATREKNQLVKGYRKPSSVAA